MEIQSKDIEPMWTASQYRILLLEPNDKFGYASGATMNATNDAIDGLECAIKLLEQALKAHLKAMRLERENIDAQMGSFATIASEKTQLQQEVRRLRTLITRYQHHAEENGSRIMQATQEIRSILGKAH